MLLFLTFPAKINVVFLIVYKSVENVPCAWQGNVLWHCSALSVLVFNPGFLFISQACGVAYSVPLSLELRELIVYKQITNIIVHKKHELKWH